MNYSRCFFCTLLLLTPFFNFSQHQPFLKAHQSFAVVTGYNNGITVNGQFTFHNFAPDAKGHIRLAIGYSIVRSGDAAEAQKIFLGTASTTTASNYGRALDFRIDYLLPKKFLNLSDAHLLAGPRYIWYKASFKSDNASFNVTYNQIGAGIGAENYFYLDRKFDLLVSTGLDFYLPGTLFGPRTFYKPNNDNINARINPGTNEPYTYKDANRAIDQPQFVPKLLIGITYYL